MRLLRVELRRLRLRPLVLFIALLACAGAAFLLVITVVDASPVTDADRQWAEQAYADAQEDWAEHGEEQVADCLEQQSAETERSGEPVDFGCAEMEPKPEWFIPNEPTLASYSDGVLLPFAMVLTLLIGVLIGATAVAAEFGAGSMATLLTFEPRRWRVYAAKMAAAGAGTVPLSLLVVALVGVGAWALFAVRGMDHAVPAQLVWDGVRMVALLPGAALVGAALAFLLRSTGAVLGAVVGYTIAVELILRQVLSAASPWIPGVNLTGWVRNGTSYYLSECTREEAGLMCETVEQHVSFAWSTSFLGVCLVVLLALAGWSFSRRDVN